MQELPKPAWELFSMSSLVGREKFSQNGTFLAPRSAPCMLEHLNTQNATIFQCQNRSTSVHYTLFFNYCLVHPVINDTLFAQRSLLRFAKSTHRVDRGRSLHHNSLATEILFICGVSLTWIDFRSFMIGYVKYRKLLYKYLL